MYTVMIVGPGYVGSALARSFKEKKQRVIVLGRSKEKLKSLEQEGIQTIQADLREDKSIPSIPPAHFIIFSIAPDSRSEKDYRETYLLAVQNFLNSIQKNPRPFLMVYLSSTGVYGEAVEGKIDEETPVIPDSERSSILKQAEDQLLNSGFPCTILRLAGIYGPGRNRISMIQKQDWPDTIENRYLNLIHRDDIVQMMPEFLNRAEAGKIYLGVDDELVLSKTFYEWLCQRLNLPFPAARFKDGKSKGKQYNNARLKSLGIQFKFPSYREGYLALTESTDS